MALSGIKILDFSRILAAPFASMILSDLDAEVWKIEQPGNFLNILFLNEFFEFLFNHFMA